MTPDGGLRGIITNVRFVGGMNLPLRGGRLGANATWPLAELVIEDDRGIVRLRRLLRIILGGERQFLGMDFAFPEIVFDPGTTVVARFSRLGVLGRGVRITPEGGRDVIFWTWEQDRVLEALIASGATDQQA